MKSILPDNDIRDYFMKIISECVSGHLSREKINFITGDNNHGKNKLFELLSMALGDYFTIINSIDNDSKNIKCTRCAVFTEKKSNLLTDHGST